MEKDQTRTGEEERSDTASRNLLPAVILLAQYSPFFPVPRTISSSAGSLCVNLYSHQGSRERSAEEEEESPPRRSLNPCLGGSLFIRATLYINLSIETGKEIKVDFLSLCSLCCSSLTTITSLLHWCFTPFDFCTLLLLYVCVPHTHARVNSFFFACNLIYGLALVISSTKEIAVRFDRWPLSAHKIPR